MARLLAGVGGLAIRTPGCSGRGTPAVLVVTWVGDTLCMSGQREQRWEFAINPEAT
jgi:hypothetical protein